MSTATFDIDAKAEEPIPAELKSIKNLDNLMLQTLLADRFKLKVHHETKEIPMYRLTVTKNGPKLTPWVTPATPAAVSAPTYAFGANLATPQGGQVAIVRMARGDLQIRHESINWLAGYLQFQPEIGGRTVADKTGLTGEYGFALKWLPEGLEDKQPSGVSKDADTPGLFTALQEQLGLKLEQSRGSTDTIVIDHVEMPSAN